MHDAAFVLFGALAGGFVSGLAGFGTGLVALGIWLHVIEPRAAASLVVVCSVVSQAQTISTIWHTRSVQRDCDPSSSEVSSAFRSEHAARPGRSRPVPARDRHPPRRVFGR
ncbi:MAG: hypothetical protein ACJ8C6_07810, partial [Microvirga sp.]